MQMCVQHGWQNRDFFIKQKRARQQLLVSDFEVGPLTMKQQTETQRSKSKFRASKEPSSLS